MKSVAIFLAFFFASMAVGEDMISQDFRLTPTLATTKSCQKAGFVGDFVLRAYSDGSGFQVVFKSSNEKIPVHKSKKGNRYTSTVHCVYGCDINLDVVIDFDADSFAYDYSSSKRSVSCHGTVQ